MVEKNNLNVPEELKAVTDEETFEKSRLYAIDKALYNFVHGFYSQIESYALLYLGALPFIWNLCSYQMSFFSSQWLNSEVKILVFFY